MMSYNSIAKMHDSEALRRRITACAAREDITNPELWTQSKMWEIVAAPGWDAAWDSGVLNFPDSDVGEQEGVITDGMILSAVQAEQA